jgi:hypothetical protein
LSINFLLVVCELSQRLQSDCVSNIRNIHGNRGLGLPSPGRFGGGLSSSPINLISVPQAMPVSGNHCECGSDMDLSSGSEDEVYGGRYSVLSSPQDDEKQVNSGHDKPHSYFISSTEKIQLKQGHGNPVELPGHTEEFLDSATSTEISFTQSRSNTCTLDGCSPSVTLRANVERTAKQVSY